jgi:hypothetical protein
VQGNYQYRHGAQLDINFSSAQRWSSQESGDVLKVRMQGGNIRYDWVITRIPLCYSRFPFGFFRQRSFLRFSFPQSSSCFSLPLLCHENNTCRKLISDWKLVELEQSKSPRAKPTKTAASEGSVMMTLEPTELLSAGPRLPRKTPRAWMLRSPSRADLYCVIRQSKVTSKLRVRKPRAHHAAISLEIFEIQKPFIVWK